ncbi:MAG: hypothetical protein CALGDGBN_02746 [Pseudomonadales bacterium]|nr:hypothetical protein [Pseudomonadales bacterium]
MISVTDPDSAALALAALLSGAALSAIVARLRGIRLERAHAQRLEELRESLLDARTELAGNAARHAAERQAADEKLALLGAAREQLALEFTALANRIFEEKNERFGQHSRATLELTLRPLREQLTDFRRRIDEVHGSDTDARARLLQELGSLKELNRRMSDEALNLTRALKGDNRVQGHWGEVILERILEESGLRKGHEYDTQVVTRDGEGQRRAPDVVVRLPEGRDVVIDSKVSLNDYERYCSAQSDEERDAALRAHVASLQAHVTALSAKDYAGLEGIRTLDFVLVFVPIEAAFMKAMEHDATLFGRAFAHNIILVSPTTLLATLRTIDSLWRLERQNRNAEEIARRAGALHDQFARVLESLEDLGRHLQRTSAAYEQTVERLARGRGNLVGRVMQLARLGAKARKPLPEAIVARAELDDSPEDEGEST